MGVQTAAKQARYYFGLNLDPSPEEIMEVAKYYPVFRVAYVGEKGVAGPAEPAGRRGVPSVRARSQTTSKGDARPELGS